MKFNQFIYEIKKKIAEESFSGSIHITQNDETIYANAYGYANRAEKIPNRIDTSFAIASGTKLFTALAIGHLVDDGIFTLDDRAFDLIKAPLDALKASNPSIESIMTPDRYNDNITVAQLLSHTSGMPDYYDEEIGDYEEFKLPVANHELHSPFDYFACFPNREAKFQPGSRFSYSNGGYILLSAIVEAQSGISFQSYVEKKILKPLGMVHSGFFLMNQLPANTALGYVDESNPFKTNIYDVPIIALVMVACLHHPKT